MYQKWPDRIFSTVKIVFSHDGHFGVSGGGGELEAGAPSPSFNYSLDALPSECWRSFPLVDRRTGTPPPPR